MVHQIGMLESSEASWVTLLYSLGLPFLAICYGSKIALRKKLEPKSRNLVDASILLFILFGLLVHYQVIAFNQSESLANLSLRHFFRNLLITVLFLVELSKLSLSVNKLALHPATVFVLSFIVLILLGTGMLMLPNATVNGISWIDALFTSASAVCVTGLIVLDTSSEFTFLGQFMIMILFQVGGLGIMTFTSFFGFFFKGNYSLQNQLFLRDFINEDNISAVRSTLVKIIVFTVAIEGFAALLIYAMTDPSLFKESGDLLFFSVFHSISGFCNAGFSTLKNGLYEEGFRELYNVHLVIAITIILGGLGFPVFLGYFNYFRHLWVGARKMVFQGEQFKHVPRVVNINIRLIVYTTLILLVVGFVTYYVFESDHTLKGLSPYGKIVTAFFGSVTPRTAGFNTVDMTALALPTVLIYLILMWIGASPGSTGGGLKTSTFAVAVLNTLSVAKGKTSLEVFGRRISNETIKKAFAVILLSFLVIGLGVFLVLLFNPELRLIDVAFEIFSAFSTVGLSLGITASLSTGSKLVVIFIMFLGRVGTLTVLVAFLQKARISQYKLPKETVFIS
jgi:potassium uptake TrkH family protein